MNWTLTIGVVVVTGLVIMFAEHEKTLRVANANAQSSADASVWAVENQGNEITNIPPAGQYPANTLSEAPNAGVNNIYAVTPQLTPQEIAEGDRYNAQGELESPEV